MFILYILHGYLLQHLIYFFWSGIEFSACGHWSCDENRKSEDCDALCCVLWAFSLPFAVSTLTQTDKHQKYVMNRTE